MIIDIRIMIPPAGQPETCEEVELEVHEIGDEVKCVGGFPGISSGGVRFFFSGGQIMVIARDGERIFRAAEVPPPDKSTIIVSLIHGVLEIGYRRLPGPDRAESH